MDLNALRRLAGISTHDIKAVSPDSPANDFRRLAGLPALPVAEAPKEDEVDLDDMDDDTPEEQPAEEMPADELPSIVSSIAAEAEGKTGDELAQLIKQVYDAGVADGKSQTEESEPEEEPEVKEAVKLSDIQVGDMVTFFRGEHDAEVRGRVVGLKHNFVEVEALRNNGLTGVFSVPANNILEIDKDSEKEVDEATKQAVKADVNETDHCPSCSSADVKMHSDGEKECNDCHKTWDVQGVKENKMSSFDLIKQAVTLSK